MDVDDPVGKSTKEVVGDQPKKSRKHDVCDPVFRQFPQELRSVAILLAVEDNGVYAKALRARECKSIWVVATDELYTYRIMSVKMPDNAFGICAAAGSENCEVVV